MSKITRRKGAAQQKNGLKVNRQTGGSVPGGMGGSDCGGKCHSPPQGLLCLQPMFLFTLLTWVLGSPSTPCPAQKLLHFLRAPSQSLPCIPARCPHLHLIAVALSCKTGGLKICFRFHIYIVLTYIYHHV